MNVGTITIVVVILILLYWWKINRAAPRISAVSPARRTNVNAVTSKTSRSKNSKTPDEEPEVSSTPIVKDEKDEANLKALQLIPYEEDENLQNIKKVLESMAKPRPELMSLLQPINEPKELYKIISKDLKLLGKVLEQTNSAYYRLDKPIENLHHAVVYLGVVQVRSIATNFALRESVAFSSSKQQAAYDRIWKASFVASEIARLFVQELRLENANGLATSCQLSYLGDVAFIMAQKNASRYYLGSFNLVDRIHAAQNTLHTHQGNLGKLMIHTWHLPEKLTYFIEHKFWPLAKRFDERTSIEEMQQKIVLYVSCALAEKLVFEQDQNIINRASFNYSDNGAIEFYHMEGLLKRASLTNLHQVAFNPTFKRKIASLLNQ
ncbi:MAG: HDOD domain-containing protein [Pseudomonadota bacterium]